MTAAKTSVVVRQPNWDERYHAAGNDTVPASPATSETAGYGAAGAHTHGAGEDGEAGFVQASGQRHADQRPHEVELPKLRNLAQQRQQDAPIAAEPANMAGPRPRSMRRPENGAKAGRDKHADRESAGEFGLGPAGIRLPLHQQGREGIVQACPDDGLGNCHGPDDLVEICNRPWQPCYGVAMTGSVSGSCGKVTLAFLHWQD
jgi:hypothetical protein